MVKAGQFEGDVRGLLGCIVLFNVENCNDLRFFQRISRDGSRKGKPLATTNRCELGQMYDIYVRDDHERIGGLDLFLNRPGNLDVGPGDEGILATLFGEREFQNVILSDFLDIGEDVAMEEGIYVGFSLDRNV